MMPRETGRDAHAARRQARAAEARAREESPERYGDELLAGDGFSAELARRKAWQQRKECVHRRC